MSRQRLAIHPAPFKPSHLSIPPSPFSPLSPLTPAAKPQSQDPTTSTTTTTPSSQPTPSTPLHWVWTCHACHSAYPLGATRRCLDDGHHFCAGTTLIKRWRSDAPKRRTKRHKACASEFDYLGWKTWGRWKRSARTTPPHNPRELLPLKKNCWTQCDYPSQCRWGRKVGIHTPTPTRTSFSLDINPAQTTPTDLPSLNPFSTDPATPFPERGEPFGTLGRALEANARRRKSVDGTSPPSPLHTGFNAERADIRLNDTLALDPRPTIALIDDHCIDPALLALSYAETSYTGASSTSRPSRTTVEPRPPEKQRTLNKIKTLLSFSSAGLSGASVLPVSHKQRKLRRRQAQRMPDGVFTAEEQRDVVSSLESGRRWSESVGNMV